MAGGVHPAEAIDAIVPASIAEGLCGSTTVILLSGRLITAALICQAVQQPRKTGRHYTRAGHNGMSGFIYYCVLAELALISLRRQEDCRLVSE